MKNKRFGKWLVLGYIQSVKPGKHYECLCHCGTVKIIPGTTLRARRSKQCMDCNYRELYDPNRIIGKKFGKWTIIKFVDMHRKSQRYEVECECGFRKLHIASELRAKKSTQCVKCHNRENALSNIKHGMHNTKIYKVWSSMVARCKNKKSSVYKYYGGRGIEVCERWLKFENFLEDMGEPKEGLTLDRINNDGNYERSNCRWVTHKENCNNRSNKKSDS